MSTIGDKLNPPEEGATTSGALTYWACTARFPETQISASNVFDSNRDIIATASVTSVQSIITTASMTAVGSITFKMSLYNPWTPPDCYGTTADPTNSTGSHAQTQARETQAFIRARGHSLIIPSSITAKGGLAVSTVVSGTFTL